MLYFVNYLIKKIVLLTVLFFVPVAWAAEVPIYDFSIKPYSQNVNDYLSPESADYSTSLLKPEYQTAQMRQFYLHYYSSEAQSLSPWNEHMIRAAIPVVKKIELEILKEYDNQNKPESDRHYAENFKEHDAVWFKKIKQNMDFAAIDALEYNIKNRAIAVNNTSARALPELAPDFFHFSLPGQGFPFDNLQESVVWAGTPLYVFSVSQDKSWSLVFTPDSYFAWVKSSDIAYASNRFINQWQTAAQTGLVAVTETDTSIVNKQQHFQFTGYIGAVFPLYAREGQQTSILIPTKNEHHQAIISKGFINTNSSSLMPLAASPKNIARLLKQLQNRPYGWGGLFYFNDCSQELKSIFAPLGIWLPRNSGQQAKMSIGLDLTADNVDERLNILKDRGHPLMTIIYIGGHVMLYMGNKTINNHERAVITYQNIWGLTPENKERRYVIGQSLFLPLLKQYPENPDITSLANKSYFKLIHLDELNEKISSPEDFVRNFAKPNNPQLSL